MALPHMPGTHPKRRAVASVPAPAAALPDNNDAKDNNNDNCDNDNNNVDLPHAEGLVIDIVGIAASDCGCQCREHNVCCGKVVNVDILVRLRREEILVPNVFLGKGNTRKQTAITVDCVTNGFEQCRVGFLPLLYVPDAALYDGALCQVIEVFDIDESSCTNRAK